MNNEIIIAIDPSFRGFGMSILIDNKVYLYELTAKQKSLKTLEGCYYATKELCEYFDNVLVDLNINKIKAVVVETPGFTSLGNGLFGLGTGFQMHLNKYDIKHRLFLNVNYLRKVHGGKYDKKDSVELAKKELEKYAYQINTKKLTHNQAESFIMLLAGMLKYSTTISNERRLELYSITKNASNLIFEDFKKED